MTLLEQFLDGDSRALSKLITHVENRRPGYRDLLANVYNRTGKALRVGITGPPGAGKSTLVSALTSKFLAENKQVGIVAVDPTSPFTGGALLGDRVRMNNFPADGSVFFRSMATRGASGGLAGSTDNVCHLLDAFGIDIVMIETVGVGQVELDVIDSCDVVLVVIVPESGDAVQTMKAGLMEIANIMVVNKSDRPGSDRLVDDLTQAMHFLLRASDDWEVPVVATVATDASKITELFDKVADFVDQARKSGKFEQRRQEQIRKKVLSIVKFHFQLSFLDPVIDQIEFKRTVEAICAGQLDPFSAGQQLYDRYVKTSNHDS